MTVTLVLALILLVLMWLIGGLKGLGAFISLGLNIVILVIVMTLLSWGFNLYMVTGIGGLLILTVTILSTGADEDTAMSAMAISLLIMCLLILVIVPVTHWSQAYGFAGEHASMLESLSLTMPVNFMNLAIAAALLATLGAISEATVAFFSTLNAIYRDASETNFTKLYKASQDAGISIVGTAMNTVLFGFFAEFLGAALLFAKLQYGFSEIINAKLFVATMLSVLFSLLGVILVLPITLIYFYYQRKDSTRKSA